MSADLFAEFNSLSNSQPSPRQEPSATINTTSNPPQGQGSFGFLANQHSQAFSSTKSPTFPSSPQVPQTNSSGSWNGQQPWSTQQPPKPLETAGGSNDDDDEGWGDFEVATPQPSQQQQFQPPPQKSAASANPGEEVRNRLTRVSTLDIFSNKIPDFTANSKTTQQQRHQPSNYDPWDEPSPPAARKTGAALQRGPSDPNVLFDAEDFELQGGQDDAFDDDDFGEFETVMPTSQPTVKPSWASSQQPSVPLKQSAPPSMDLLSLDDPPEQSPSNTSSLVNHKPTTSQGAFSFGSTFSKAMPSATQPGSAPVQKSFSASNTSNRRPPTNASAKAKPSTTIVGEKASPQIGEEEWGSWDDFRDTAPSTTAKASQPEPGNWDWDAAPQPSPQTSIQQEDSVPPPVNVPPPSVILSAFPDLFGSADTLFKPMSAQAPSIRDRILSDPKTLDFLQSYLLIASTAGRIIAGRKQRWHRDKILAKSMSISAAGSKGMKLAGIDKTQSAREDREAEDVAAAWKNYIGRVRSAVAAANSSRKTNLKVPELSGTMQIQTAKSVPTSAKPCVICGLKREERVTKVDFDIEDSFGEWWAEHWGHRACKNFWVEHEQRLRQR